MAITTDQNFTQQTDALFKSLCRLRHKELASKEKLSKIKECIQKLYNEKNTQKIKNNLLQVQNLSLELEKQSTPTKNKPQQIKKLRIVKRKKQLAKNIGGNSP